MADFRFPDNFVQAPIYMGTFQGILAPPSGYSIESTAPVTLEGFWLERMDLKDGTKVPMGEGAPLPPPEEFNVTLVVAPDGPNGEKRYNPELTFYEDGLGPSITQIEAIWITVRVSNPTVSEWTFPYLPSSVIWQEPTSLVVGIDAIAEVVIPGPPLFQSSLFRLYGEDIEGVGGSSVTTWHNSAGTGDATFVTGSSAGPPPKLVENAVNGKKAISRTTGGTGLELPYIDVPLGSTLTFYAVFKETSGGDLVSFQPDAFTLLYTAGTSAVTGPDRNVGTSLIDGGWNVAEMVYKKGTVARLTVNADPPVNGGTDNEWGTSSVIQICGGANYGGGKGSLAFTELFMGELTTEQRIAYRAALTAEYGIPT